MAFTIGSGTFTNGSATVTGVTLTSGTLAYFASGTRMVVGVNPVIQEVEAIAAPTVSTITLRSAWTGTGGTYSFLANQTSEGLRDAVQAIRTNNASLQSFIDSIDTAATADSVAQRTSDGSINAVNVYASANVGIGTSSPSASLDVNGRINLADAFELTWGGTSASIYGSSTNNQLRMYTSNTERLRIDSSGNVGIGTSPTERLEVQTPSGVNCLIKATKSGTDSIQVGVDTMPYINGGALLGFKVGGTERARMDSDGGFLVGTTTANVYNGTTTGVAFTQSGYIFAGKSSDAPMYLNRISNDGAIAYFQKDGSAVGAITVENNGINIGTGDVGLRFSASEDAVLPFNIGANAVRDNAIDLGSTNYRFDDIYATNGTIQTSDRNEKQDIEELSEAEHRVAIACKSLLRKFRWKSSVEEKGDDARIHFGIIAQDLQAAFEAEGLNAGRYAIFTHTERWEHEVEVPAVEAQDAIYETVVTPAEYDEEGNEVNPETTEQRLVSEAVEGQDAYTRTETYYTEEEAPDGAVKKSRMGVRYSELLAFIIAGI